MTAVLFLVAALGLSSAVLQDEMSSLDQRLSSYASLGGELSKLHPTKEAAVAYIIGHDLAFTGHHRQAMAHFLNAAELDDSSPSPWAAMAISLAAMNRHEASLKAWRETLLRDPMNSRALFMVGIDASASGDYQTAARLLSRLRIHGEDLPTDALLRDAALTNALHMIGDQETSALLQAKEDQLIKTALVHLLRGGETVWISALQQLVDVGNPRVALQLAQGAAPKLDPQRLALVLSAMPIIEVAARGDGTVTLETYKTVGTNELIPLRPRWFEPKSLAYALSTAAQSMSSVGAVDAPIKLYKASLELDPFDIIVINNYAWTLLQRDGPSQEAVALAKQAYEADPEAGFVLDTFGYAKLLQGKPSDAIDLFIRALDATGGDPTIRDHLGDAFWQARQRRDAISAWQKAYHELRSEESYISGVKGFQGMAYSVWGISIATPEALYDLELGSVMRRLKQKLTAVKEGKDPFGVNNNGVR
ncbi:tetratricopeptide repeat protein [PVC group bacterium]|nr:tetratricopeptide repeat protein [PVC group bacterium]